MPSATPAILNDASAHGVARILAAARRERLKGRADEGRGWPRAGRAHDLAIARGINLLSE